MFRKLGGIGLFCLAGAACQGQFESEVAPEDQALFGQPDAVEILALDPGMGMGGGEQHGEGWFHGYEVLGRAWVEEDDASRELLGLIKQGIDDSDGMVAACFLPRHGVRILGKERELHLVICFQCLQIDMHEVGPEGGAGEEIDGVLTDSGVEPEISGIYRAHGLKLAPR